MKIGAIMWSSYMNMLVRSAKSINFLEPSLYSTRQLEEQPDMIDSVMQQLEEQDIVLLYRSSDDFWGLIEDRLKALAKKVPVVCVSHDPSYWGLSTVRFDIVAKTYAYLLHNGEDNFKNMLLFLCKKVKAMDITYKEPQQILWEGIYHPDYQKVFSSTTDFLSNYAYNNRPLVGILFPRHDWINDNCAVEDLLIKELEKRGMGVVPVFAYGSVKAEFGCRGSLAAMRDFFLTSDQKPCIKALVKLQPFILGNRSTAADGQGDGDEGVSLFKKLDIPVFCPINSYYTSAKEWEENTTGLTGSHIAWSIALPEFEGVIEPMIISATKKERENSIGAIIQEKEPVIDRCERIAARVAKWVQLREKPVSQRKIAFILNNNPCASVEASVGGAAKLDTLKSVCRVLHAMKEKGYNVEPPASGKELIETIMQRKAISEFRWTTVQEIVQKGGALKLVSVEEYRKFFDKLPQKVKDTMIEAWGNPPGEEKNGVPPAMVYDGKILVTGVQYGNAVVCVQPKRGCAGARCDGNVCKILHDPMVPPPHQYLATYRFLEEDFGADALVHVGTHGNLEFLPGKGTALSSSCFPDIALGSIPHLYIYNSDNPPEGVIAKRRSNAVLVDHMQTSMVQSGLYEELEELDSLVTEYETVKNDNPARAHVVSHQIFESIAKCKLDVQIKVPVMGSIGTPSITAIRDMTHEQRHHADFGPIVRACHEALSSIRNTQIQDGMHIFGELPQGQRRVDFINAIMRYDGGDKLCLRRVIAELMGLSFDKILANPAQIHNPTCRSYGQILEQLDIFSRQFIAGVLADDCIKMLVINLLGEDLQNKAKIKDCSGLAKRIKDINEKIEASKEIESLLHGFNGGYIEPGPSGLIMRGREDILPTGRNFFTLDPHRIPTKSAWVVGQKLADAIIAKHLKDNGRHPENVAMYWMANDIMWADGEGMAQIMYLLGVEPLWQPNGRLQGFSVIPLNILQRPRIDVTIRVSGITRDNFPGCIDVIDEAVQAVASLPEPEEMNYVRKHSLAQVTAQNGSELDESTWRDVTYRIFASQPGTYQAGTQLAIYASAWKEEKDLADIFVYWNGYAYGKGVFGEKKHEQLADNLKTVDLTYNKTMSDESDLLVCCCYFGTHGGMTAAARSLSGKPVKTYYGDTREPNNIEVRDMADEIRRVVRTKLLNPKWIEGQKRHGYKGAGDISKRVGRVYGWEATTQEVDDWIFDDIAKTFVLNDENRKFFEQNNPWALEEIGRRLLEAQTRGLWNADPEIFDKLKDRYLEIESWMEESTSAAGGDFQGSAVDILTAGDVKEWGSKMEEIQKLVHKKINPDQSSTKK